MTVGILQFFQGRTFDELTTNAMEAAYNKARRLLGGKGQPKLVQEVIARKIIDLAAYGERDPELLARRALKELGFIAGR